MAIPNTPVVPGVNQQIVHFTLGLGTRFGYSEPLMHRVTARRRPIEFRAVPLTRATLDLAG